MFLGEISLQRQFGSRVRIRPPHTPVILVQPPPPPKGWPLWSSSGWFNIIWGDGPEGASQTIYTLTDDSGHITPLWVDETLSQSVGGVLWFNRKKVNVAGVWATSLSVRGAATVLNVTSISLAPSSVKTP